MKIDNTIENKFKTISIRGRLAFGIKCIEQYIDENDINDTWLDKLIQTLWEFTISEQLDEWEDKIRVFEPSNVLDVQTSNYGSLSESDFYELREFYKKQPVEFIEMIDSTIQIGLGNLYGGTGEYSEFTLTPTLEVYDIGIRILKNMPDVEKYSIFRFSEFHGWGNKIRKEMFEK